MGSKIAFAGLTAAGKTTHAKLLADALGFRYVSATEILLEILEIDAEAERVWFSRSEEITQARLGDVADWELERRLQEICDSDDDLVIDSWAMAWIGRGDMVRIWIESDEDSRTRKCFVSQGEKPKLDIQGCLRLISSKDEETRQNFERRHEFDLCVDRDRYNLVLNNSHLIPHATRSDANQGIRTFSHVLEDCVKSVLYEKSRIPVLAQLYPQEVIFMESNFEAYR